SGDAGRRAGVRGAGGTPTVGRPVQSAGGFHGAHSWAVGRATRHAIAHGQLLRLGLRWSAGLFAHPLWSGASRTLFPGGRPCPSATSYPTCLVAARGRADVVLEFLRSTKRHQRPHHDAHPRAVHRPNCRRVPATPPATGSAAPLPYLVRSAAVRSGAGRLAVRLRDLRQRVRRSERVDAVGRRRCLPALVAANRRLAFREGVHLTSPQRQQGTLALPLSANGIEVATIKCSPIGTPNTEDDG